MALAGHALKNAADAITMSSAGCRSCCGSSQQRRSRAISWPVSTHAQQVVPLRQAMVQLLLLQLGVQLGMQMLLQLLREGLLGGLLLLLLLLLLLRWRLQLSRGPLLGLAL